MDYVGFALPILPGQTGAARAFQRALGGERKEAYAASERAIGITKELWFVQETPNGDLFVAYMESGDFGRALGQFAASRGAFDVWFKEQLAAVTGVDLNEPPPGPLSDLASHYEAAPRVP
ncbi:MAG TPA: hypothetical protein VFW96_20040 [Thermomicrobiales bacterium]|nr:hypothetical protein [Thermomicrobiales bacterium]